MKKQSIICLLLFALSLCFTSCRKADPASRSVVSASNTSSDLENGSNNKSDNKPDDKSVTSVSSKDMPDITDSPQKTKEDIFVIRDWFDNDYSFTLREEYCDLAV